MKAKFCLAVVLFAFLSLSLIIQIYAADYSWKDDFNYTSLQEMQTAGWVIENPSGTSLQSDGVVIDGTDADTVIRYRDFPEGLNDWSVETKSMWIGGNHSCPGLDVITENHVYSFSGNGWYDDLNFDRDGVTQTIGSYIDTTGWVTMTLTKEENTISLYLNGELMYTFIESDTSPSGLIEVDRIAPWKGIMLYDYYQVNSDAIASTGDFPIAYVAIGGGVATAAVGGVAAYIFLIAKGGSAVAAGAGAAAVGAGALVGDGTITEEMALAIKQQIESALESEKRFQEILSKYTVGSEETAGELGIDTITEEMAIAIKQQIESALESEKRFQEILSKYTADSQP